jgi:uracil phosphoribosyltransferase
MIHLLSEKKSIICQFIAEIRDEKIQQDRLRFRRNLERIGEMAAIEISKTMEYEIKEVITPLGTASVPVLKEQPIVGTILRAGLPLHHGVLNYFDHADNAFISAYRRHHKDGSFEIHLDYVSSPPIQDRVLIIADPMLASGQSMVQTLRALIERGRPSKIHIVTAIASTEGIEYVKAHLPFDFDLWAAAIDEELTAHAYIVPGLGDAGDLAFGTKS